MLISGGGDPLFAGHAEKMNQAQALVVVAAELGLFLRPGRRGGPVRVALDGTSSLGHLVESLGVPLTEVGRFLVNGEPALPGYRPGSGDAATVDPVRRPQHLEPARFVLHVHLGTLARRLRLVGVDTANVKPRKPAESTGRTHLRLRVPCDIVDVYRVNKSRTRIYSSLLYAAFLLASAILMSGDEVLRRQLSPTCSK